MMRRLTTALTLTGALLATALCLTAPASAAAAPGGITGPTPVPAPPSDLKAGDVCPFPVHLAFPIDDEVAYTYTDSHGRVTAQYFTGRLVGVITRTDTGRSVRRDLSGSGVQTYATNGSSALTGYGPALIGFHTGDTPEHQLIVLAGFSQVRFEADGHRVLTFGRGYEDLCRTLA